jgi:hypothetical protein
MKRRPGALSPTFALSPALAAWTTLAALATLAIAAGLGAGCAHPPPRGPIATTRAGVAPAAGSCGDASSPFLAELCGMGEPSLSVSGPETYRFVLTRHLHNPVAVRVSRAGAEVALVSVQADARDPSVSRRHEFTVGPEVWTSLQRHLEAADFWNLAGDPEDNERGLDGADWILEGRRANIYHSVIRWQPKLGPFRDACEVLINASGLSFPAEIR